MDETSEFFGPVRATLADRPPPAARRALAATGGTLVATGLIGAIVGDGTFERALILLAGGLCGAAGYLWCHFSDHRWRREAGVAALAIAVPVVVVGLVGDSSGIEAEPTLVLMALAYGGLWAAPATRARPVLLGLALWSLWALVLQIADDSATDVGSIDGLSWVDGTSIYAVSMLMGVGLLGSGYVLDRRGLSGVVATPFFAVGNLAYWVGTIGLAAQFGDASGGGVLIVAAGVAACYVGSRGRHRRATTWTGAAACGIGVVVVWAELIDGASSVRGPALVLLLAGGALIVAVALVEFAPGGTDAAPPAGWYPNPTGEGQRYWDGAAWTDHYR